MPADERDEGRAFHMHLVSDATGETAHVIARASLAHFPHVKPIEHLYALVTTKEALEESLERIVERPGLVLYTFVSEDLERRLRDVCRAHAIPAISALSSVVAALETYLEAKHKPLVAPGGQHVMDRAYFDRIEALNFAIAHDDGQMLETLDEAEVVLVGISRTSKTPTCFYLAHRGVRAANVPLVPDIPPPDALLQLKRPLIVGLTIAPARLSDVRKKRLSSGLEAAAQSYSHPDRVSEESLFAQRLFARESWPVVDVTYCSVEETAAAVGNLLREKQERDEEGLSSHAS